LEHQHGFNGFQLEKAYGSTIKARNGSECLKAKFERAKGIEGFKYIHAVIPCPTGWRFNPAKSVEVVCLSVQTWAWPLYEIEGGVLKVSLKPTRSSIEDYLKAQNRFRHLTDDQIQYVQSEVNTKRQRLLENDGKKVIL
jgi:pyruvate ferredoxin oxidoreductase beta subunit